MPLKSGIIFKCKIPCHHVLNLIKLKRDKLFYVCSAVHKIGKSMLSTHTRFVLLQILAGKGNI